MTVVEVEFGECAAHGERGPGEQIGRTRHGLGLADRPQTDAVGPSLARGIVRVLVMMLLQRGKQIELERDPRMACGHHRMGDELVAVGAAVMAVETDLGAHLRLLERDHARRHIGLMRGRLRIVHRQPVGGGTMAAFAADAVRRQEARPAPLGRNQGRMAAEALRCRRRRAETERFGDLAATRPRQHGIGAAMRPGR